MINDIKKILFGILFGVAFGAILYTSIKVYTDYKISKIMENPETIEGIVYDKDYIKGRGIKVIYTVDGRTYYVSRGASIEEAKAIKVGDHLTVKYEKGNPGNSRIIW
jgi:lipopolysaccharide export system protein LptA